MNANAIIIADLGFGDAGKGSITDAIVRQNKAHTVVRYNGGCQAAHNVVTSDGKHHVFAQFGSGMLVPGTKTHLSRFMFIDPLAMMREEECLRQLGVRDAFERTTIDENAVVITPFHRAANRIREVARGEKRHGSCGRGVGEAASDALQDPVNLTLRIGDLRKNSQQVAKKLGFIQGVKYAQVSRLIKELPDKQAMSREIEVLTSFDVIPKIAVHKGYRRFADKRHARIVGSDYLGSLLKEGTVVFEGAQGVLLDQQRGFAPYTTWSDTTFNNAIILLSESSYQGRVTKLGVVRGYGTRHGPGPFLTEDSTVVSVLTHEHNMTNEWQGSLRTGWLDLVQLRYAVEVCGGVDCLAINHLDQLARLQEGWKIAFAYELKGMTPPFWFFRKKGNFAEQIIPASDQSLLTAVLMSEYTVPQYRHFSGEPGLYLRYLEENLGVPIVITSSGPTAEDKQFLPVWQKIVS